MTVLYRTVFVYINCYRVYSIYGGNMSRKHVLKNSSFYIIGSVFTRGIGFIMLPIYTYFLTPDVYGKVNLLNSFIQVMIFIVGLSLYAAISRFYVKYKDDTNKIKRLFGSIYVFLVISGLFFALLSVVFNEIVTSYFLKGIDFYPLIMMTLFTVLFVSIYTMHQNVIMAMQRGMKSMLINVVVFLSQAIINVILIGVFKWGAYGIMLSQLVINGLYMLYAYFDLRRQSLIKLCFDRKLLGEALRYSVPLMPHNLSTRIAAVISKIFLNNSYSLASVGVYGIALQFGSIIDIIQISMNKAIKPWLFEVLSSDQDQHKEVLELTSIITIGFTFIYVGIGFFSKEVITILLPEVYETAWRVIPLFLLGYSIKGLYYFYLNIMLYHTHASKKVFTATLTGSLFNIFLAAILIPVLDMYGAALSFVLSKFLIFMIIMMMYKKYQYSGIKTSKLLLISINGLIIMGLGTWISFSTLAFAYGFLLKLMILIVYMTYLWIRYKSVLYSVLKRR